MYIFTLSITQLLLHVFFSYRHCSISCHFLVLCPFNITWNLSDSTSAALLTDPDLQPKTWFVLHVCGDFLYRPLRRLWGVSGRSQFSDRHAAWCMYVNLPETLWLLLRGSTVNNYCCCVVSLTGNNSHLTWLEIQIINRHCKIGQIDITGLFLDWFVTDFRQLIPFTWQQTSQWGTYLRKVHRVTSRGSWCHWSRDKWKYRGYF